MPPRVPFEAKQEFWRWYERTGEIRTSALRAGVSYTWAKSEVRGTPRNGDDYREARVRPAKPVPFEELCPEARRGLDDFEFFRWFYLGHVSTPWQIDAAYRLVELLESPQKEYAVENEPPGTGKSTLITDLGSWVTCRNRSLRGLMGSRKAANGRRQVNRIRRNFERHTPYRPRSEDVTRGLAVDAHATLAGHYGVFKPSGDSRDIWRADEFVVAQFDDVPIEEKEPTWSSYGVDSGVLSNRFDLIFWDDLVDRTNTRTFDAQKELEDKWDEELETRLEPGGLLVLVGQRMHATDLYHFCLTKQLRTPDEDDEEEDVESGLMYHHIVHPAHDDDRCEGKHRPAEAEAWPNGCLLDPIRLPWRDLRKIRDAKPQTYEVQYQQHDGDPNQVFLPDEWLRGGIDPLDGTLCPGCFDPGRSLTQLPEGLRGPYVSVATVDPSGEKKWGIEWWVYTPNASHQVWLMDIVNKAMPANDLLDRNPNNNEHYGVMEEWQARSHQLGLPITHWVVEINAAQRYLLAYKHVEDWMRKWGVRILPHSTGLNKLDEDKGIDTIRDHFKFGRVRLPDSQDPETRLLVRRFVDQLKNYGRAREFDLVMACWFLFVQLPNIWRPRPKEQPRLRVPSWLGGYKPASAA